MFKIKRVISIFLILIIGTLIGCVQVDKSENVTLDLFDTIKGKELAKEYLVNVSAGNIEKANELCDKELIRSNTNLTEGISKVAGFQLDKSITASEFSYYIFNVIRDSNTEPKSDLESYSIKVKRNGEQYLIEQIKSQPKRELYIKNNALRIIGEKGGKSSLVISLNNIPKDTYLRDNKVMLYKEVVPNNNFGKVVLGFTGKKIAVSTIDDNNSFICIVYIDDTLMEGGSDEISSSTPSESSTLTELQDFFEKPVSSKVVSVDLLNNCKINDFIFSKEDDNIAVNYKDSNGGERVNIYKAEDGELIETNFKELFPTDVYNIKGDYFDDSKLIFNITKKDNNNDDITGKYSLDVKTSNMIKL